MHPQFSHLNAVQTFSHTTLATNVSCHITINTRENVILLVNFAYSFIYFYPYAFHYDLVFIKNSLLSLLILITMFSA